MTHRHEYWWTFEPAGAVWLLEARCDCGHVAWGCTARDDRDLKATVIRAIRIQSMTNSAAFGAPVEVPTHPTYDVPRYS